ncbi:hypothetical protein DVH24_014072, partial [Malus domestica]
VASAIALPIRRKFENGGWSTARTVDFRGLKPPHTIVNQGGSWLGFVEGNESLGDGVEKNPPELARISLGKWEVAEVFSPGMMGYKAQVVASAIALLIRRKFENRGRSTARTVDCCGLKPPHTMVNQGGSWLGFVEGNESFKMVVMASKNSTRVGHNRPWKMGGRGAQVVASAIALPIRSKFENGGRSTARTVDFRGLKPPHTMVNQGGSWLGFVEGNESFKMVVMASKNSTRVGQNQPWKMGSRRGVGDGEARSFLPFLFFFFFVDWLKAFLPFI